MWISSANNPRKFESWKIYFGDSNLMHFTMKPSSFTEAFGASAVMQFVNGFVVGGTTKTTSVSTGFVPVLGHAGLNVFSWLDVPDEAPYYGVDAFRQMNNYANGILYFFATPRSSTYAHLQTSSNPILVGAMYHQGLASCKTNHPYIILTYLIKFKHNEPDKYTIPLDIGHQMNNTLYLTFLQTTNAPPDMSMSGTDNSYVAVATAYLHIYCHTNEDTRVYDGFYSDTFKVITGTNESLITFTDTPRPYEYFGRHCYTPTGVSPYCTLLDARFIGE